MTDNLEHHSPRWIRTHYTLYHAFLELIHDYNPEDITVSSVTHKAGIHRKTFYLHYSNIDELFEEHIHTLLSTYSARIMKLPLPYDYFQLSEIMFDFYTSSPEIEKIFTHPRYRALADRFTIEAMKDNRARYNPYRNFTDAEQELINTFVVYSSANVWRRWALSGKKVPMKRAVEILGHLLEHGVEDLRATYSNTADNTD
ncbi:TetR/AcrR family transcriptional regulator [Alloscardovia omnicolens]|uniref:TetR/AcrR family transcriptional regulator n=1 Tax=Alloscardovia omnicolens TaxID=419015 RepID=UPI003A65E19B